MEIKKKKKQLMNNSAYCKTIKKKNEFCGGKTYF